ncbi:hypothetical protein [Oceanobacillus kimchii]|uniref:hypothetical protein n=1 Tax=Oceanobacillus kimchii TaxID=746691 RepID=UPI00034654B4|nr:hypothetical protein [Oceanobacillus kimchii]
MEKRTYLLIPIILLTFLLTGCLYPQSEKSENQIPYEEQLQTVQQSVNSYKEGENGLVPIQTKDNDTPEFEKYLIDFSQLREKGYLSEPPGNSFEKGGVYQYTLLNPEDDPTVKLIDLRITEEIRRVNVQLDFYRQENYYPAFGKKITDKFYTIDYNKLGLEEAPTVTSPFSQEELPIIMDLDGNLFVDYSYDLNNAIQEYNHAYSEGDDIRYLLTDHSPFVPAYSVPYTIKDNQVIFSEEME